MAKLDSLRSAGMVLIIAGAADLALMIYCIAEGVPYSSSLNVFAIAGGIFLWRGSLRAAAIIGAIALFLVAAAPCVAVVALVAMPWDLTVLRWRSELVSNVWQVLCGVAAFAVCGWVAFNLHGTDVRQARRVSTGKAKREIAFPIAAAAGLAAILGFSIPAMLHGPDGKRAEHTVAAALGENYKYAATGIQRVVSTHGTFVHVTVAAYNDREVKMVPVDWRE